MSDIRHLLMGLAITVLAQAPIPALAKAETQAGACALAEELALGQAPQPLVDLPFRTIDGRIYVDALVNGQGPHVFAVDTGASGIGRADASLVTLLALPPAGAGHTSDGVQDAAVDTVHIASLALGGLVRTDVTVIARDYRSRVSLEAAFSGILAREFFADGLLLIDFPARRLRFFSDAHLRADQAGAMTYERAFRIPVTLGAMTVTGNLDTGADVSLVIPPAIHEQLGAGPLEPAGNASLTNTTVASLAGRYAGPVRIGEAVLTDVPVRVIDAFREVLVGAHALTDQRVLIDQRHRTLAVCPAQAG